jgi:hypothetical protein
MIQAKLSCHGRAFAPFELPLAEVRAQKVERIANVVVPGSNAWTLHLRYSLPKVFVFFGYCGSKVIDCLRQWFQIMYRQSQHLFIYVSCFS